MKASDLRKESGAFAFVRSRRGRGVPGLAWVGATLAPGSGGPHGMPGIDDAPLPFSNLVDETAPQRVAQGRVGLVAHVGSARA